MKDAWAPAAGSRAGEPAQPRDRAGMASVLDFQKRFSRRVIGALPADLAAMECEDAMQVLRHWVPRLIDQIDDGGGKRRPAYARRAYFSIPASPPVSRLRSAKGYIPFHFSRNLVAGRTAKAFDDYARGKAQVAGTGRESETAQAVEGLAEGRMEEASAHVPEDGRAGGVDGATKHAYLSSHGGVDGGPARGWSNLRDAADWHAIEAVERDGRVRPDGNPPGLSLFYQRAPALFDALAHQPECPRLLAALIASEQARAAEGRPLSARKARDGIRWVDARAFDTYAWIKAQPGWPHDADAGQRPVRVSEGRAVQTHVAGEGEYPAILDAAARLRIRTGLVALVQRQRNPTSDTGAGWFVPMTICDHAPDGLNDPLNDHYHWILGTRRARYTEAGTLAFEPRKVHAMTRADWLAVMRAEVARLTNIELTAAGADVLYHPGTLAEMGIDAVPQQKLHAHATVLERAGVSTARGLANTAEGWRRAFVSADRDHEAALAEIEAALPGDTPVHKEARRDRIEAADLRHEAAQIALLAAMSTSRAERTLRFAPAYADRASSPTVAAGWRTRGEEAARHFAHLDLELAPERADIARRLARAERLEREADERLAAARRADARRAEDHRIEARRTEVRRIEDLRVYWQAAGARSREVHRAVDLIMAAPLLVTAQDGQMLVAATDDPGGLVAAVDLSAVQPRLIGIHAAQQRELAQVQAFARRHGAAALFDDACETHSPWFRKAVTRWREAPVMQRYLAEREASLMQEREQALRERYARRGQRDIDNLAELPSLADVPYLGDLAGAGSRGDDHVPVRDADAAAPVVAGMPPVASVQPASTQHAAPAQQPAGLGDHSGRPAQAVRPSPQSRAPAPPALVWSEMEQRHRSLVAWREERTRRQVASAIEAALAQRVGERAFTPYAVRLLLKVGQGFDTASVPSRPEPGGPSLDQRDAAEIGVLSRDPRFRAALVAAQARDAGLIRRLGALPPAAGPDVLGRVGMAQDRLVFGPARDAAGETLRTPLEWAERTLALVAERQLPLTRQDGLVGIHDAEVLRLSHGNYPGLLHPAIQHALEVQRRIQVETERGLLAQVRAGRLLLETHLEHDRSADASRTRVRLVGESAEAQAFVAQRQFDAGFYFRCREAAAGQPANAPVLRHDQPVVRAWLEACDEGAALPVRNLLAREVRKLPDVRDLRTDNMVEADAKTLAHLLAPGPALVRPRPGGRRNLRPGLRQQPGRPAPSR